MTKISIYNNVVSKSTSNQGNYFRNRLGKENFLILANTTNTETDYFLNNDGAYSLKYSYSGREFYHFSNKQLATTPDRYLLTNPYSRYQSHLNEDKNVRTFYAFFSTEHIQAIHRTIILDEDALLNHSNVTSKDFHFDEKLYAFDYQISHILSCIAQLALIKASQEEINQYVTELMEYLIGKQLKSTQNKQLIRAVKNSTKEELFKRLHIAKDYMDSCYNEYITVQNLAEMVAMCEHHFLRQFRNYFNITPYQYLSKRRIELAKNMLLDYKDLPINSISHQLGFENITSFNRCFKKHTGTTPTFYKTLKNQF